MYEWNEIPWRKLERRTFKLQKRIYQASKRDDVILCTKLQKLLLNSWSAKAIAVRRVTQENRGKKTAGVDGIKSLSPEARLALIGQLKLTDNSKPTRRVWIPKPRSDEKRPLSIPTIHERALQTLVKMALEPEWEARFEPNSYGFRPGKSCHDAISAIHLSINKKPKYVLDADIAKCFDRINHKKLLEKINTFPTLRRQIRAWLKAGVMDGKELFPTFEGTPQGGTISPLLANIALHGMEERIKKYIETVDIRRKETPSAQVSKVTKRFSISLIRYADDFVIMHEREEVVKQCQHVISEWLSEIGLELKPSKTQIVHTLNPYKGTKKGFNFLGFHIYQHKAGKCVSGKKSNKEILGFKTLITPSKEAIKRHYNELKKVIDSHRASKQANLIKKLNSIIIGWCNYYKPFQSSKTFKKLWDITYWKLWKWGIKRHSNKGRRWLYEKYWHTIDGKRWTFSTRQENNPLKLTKHCEISCNVKYTKVKGEFSPYDGNLQYWCSRMGKHPEMPKRTATLLKKQKGKCPFCNLNFKEGDIWEIDHIQPTAAGGKDTYDNLQLLHKHCHDLKSRSDGEAIKTHKARKAVGETREQFNKLNWIWVDDIPTMV